ncbi:MAG TPA: TetR/AcrR family transcriptional regulator [Dermatophilaceae bacterium]|nr:TetR/AcrR family transcriptional regulator [Dermatophilaceae bacterium]
MDRGGRDVSARRRRPTQARSRATYERILAATAALLQEVGWDGVSTNAIAVKAGVTVPSVYAYFPDKYAIIHELFERQEQYRVELLHELVRRASREDWEDVLRSALRAAADLRRRDAGGLALRTAMTAVPELRRLDEQSSERAAAQLASLLADLAPGLSSEQARRSARVLSYAVVPLLDHAGSQPEVDEAFLDAAARMAILYLRDIVHGAHDVPSGHAAPPAPDGHRGHQTPPVRPAHSSSRA